MLKDHGRVEEAIESFRASLVAKPEYPEVLNRLGVALFEQGKHDEAIECLRRATIIDPNFVEAYNNLGAVFTESGRHGNHGLLPAGFGEEAPQRRRPL